MQVYSILHGHAGDGNLLHTLPPDIGAKNVQRKQGL